MCLQEKYNLWLRDNGGARISTQFVQASFIYTQHIESVHEKIEYPCNQCEYKAQTSFFLFIGC